MSLSGPSKSAMDAAHVARVESIMPQVRAALAAWDWEQLEEIINSGPREKWGLLGLVLPLLGARIAAEGLLSALSATLSTSTTIIKDRDQGPGLEDETAWRFGTSAHIAIHLVEHLRHLSIPHPVIAMIYRALFSLTARWADFLAPIADEDRNVYFNVFYVLLDLHSKAPECCRSHCRPDTEARQTMVELLDYLPESNTPTSAPPSSWPAGASAAYFLWQLLRAHGVAVELKHPFFANVLAGLEATSPPVGQPRPSPRRTKTGFKQSCICINCGHAAIGSDSKVGLGFKRCKACRSVVYCSIASVALYVLCSFTDYRNLDVKRLPFTSRSPEQADFTAQIHWRAGHQQKCQGLALMGSCEIQAVYLDLRVSHCFFH